MLCILCTRGINGNLYKVILGKLLAYQQPHFCSWNVPSAGPSVLEKQALGTVLHMVVWYFELMVRIPSWPGCDLRSLCKTQASRTHPSLALAEVSPSLGVFQQHLQVWPCWGNKKCGKCQQQCQPGQKTVAWVLAFPCLQEGIGGHCLLMT